MKKLYTLTVAAFASLASFAQVSLDVLSTFRTGIFDDGAAEIVTFDSTYQKLVFTNASANEIEFLDFSDPANITSLTKVDLNAYGGGVNSASAHNGVVAVAVQADVKQDPGTIVFFDMDGNFLSQVTVGALPDMVTFTPDGQKVVVANEGEPNDDYTRDPEGSVSIIDVSAGAANVTQGDVSTASFTGVTLPSDVRVFGPDMIDLLNEDFQDTTIGITNWLQVTITPNNVAWIYDDFNGDYFAEANGFKGSSSTNGPSNDWLISPALPLFDFESAELNFMNAKNFSDNGGGTFNMFVTTDAVSDSASAVAASWDTLTFDRSPGGYTDTASGAIDLTAYTGQNIHIALNYISSGSTPGTTELWQIDDITVTGDFGANYTNNNIEPEYIAVSNNSETAYAILQENNALAIVDLNTSTVSAIVGLGYKDHSVVGNGIDPSDKDDTINIRTIPVFGMYQPDAIAYYEVAGQGYIVSANEGDARDYDAYSEEERIKDLTLDTTAFPNAAALQENEEIGRLNITTANGDTDGDGEFEELYSYGGRSFSIWNASTGALVWDSGDEIETITAAQYPDDFNSGNDENNDFEGRSDNKGPEPEAVEMVVNGDSIYALVGLERIGGVIVYNVTNPTSPRFIQYVNNRDFNVVNAELNGVTNDSIGDLGVEDVLYIPEVGTNSSKHYVVTANEISGTITVFEMNGLVNVGTEEAISETAWSVYPNPTNGLLRSNKVDDYTILDLSGKIVSQFNQVQLIHLGDLNSGLYLIKNSAGEVKKVSKQ